MAKKLKKTKTQAEIANNVELGENKKKRWARHVAHIKNRKAEKQKLSRSITNTNSSNQRLHAKELRDETLDVMDKPR